MDGLQRLWAAVVDDVGQDFVEREQESITARTGEGVSGGERLERLCSPAQSGVRGRNGDIPARHSRARLHRGGIIAPVRMCYKTGPGQLFGPGECN